MQTLINSLRWLEIILFLLSIIGLSANFEIMRSKAVPNAGKKRTVTRFGKGSIWLHWLHSVVFIFLLVTGAILFFDLAGADGRKYLVSMHIVAAVLFTALPIVFALSNIRRAATFITETFRWGKADIAWLMAAPGYYFGTSEEMPPQGRINGGQKLWQLTVVVTGGSSLPTGVVLWAFAGYAETGLYFWNLFAHGLAFVAVSVMFNVHLYMSMLHPRFEESLNSMLDGKVSESYAGRHYPLWFAEIIPKRREQKPAAKE